MRRDNVRGRLGPLLALVVALSLAAAACGGGGEAEPEEEAAPAEQEETPEEEAPEEEADSDVGSELSALGDRWAETPAAIEYEFTVETNGTTEDQGEITVFWYPPDGWRMDFASDTGGEGSFLRSGDGSFLCSGDGEPACLAFEEPIVPLPFPFLGLFEEPDALSNQIAQTVSGIDLDRSQRTIAGEEADCFSVTTTVEGQTGGAEWCFSGDGILLLSAATAEDGGQTTDFQLAATSVSRDVSEADLEPPYPIMEIGEMPGG